jgi:hypothetical protein
MFSVVPLTEPFAPSVEITKDVIFAVSCTVTRRAGRSPVSVTNEIVMRLLPPLVQAASTDEYVMMTVPIVGSA